MTLTDQLLEACKAILKETESSIDVSESTEDSLRAAIAAAESLEQPVDEAWLKSIGFHPIKYGEDSNGDSLYDSDLAIDAPEWGVIAAFPSIDGCQVVMWRDFEQNWNVEDIKSRRQLLDLLSGLGVEVTL